MGQRRTGNRSGKPAAENGKVEPTERVSGSQRSITYRLKYRRRLPGDGRLTNRKPDGAGPQPQRTTRAKHSKPCLQRFDRGHQPEHPPRHHFG